MTARRAWEWWHRTMYLVKIPLLAWLCVRMAMDLTVVFATKDMGLLFYCFIRLVAMVEIVCLLMWRLPK